MRWLLLLFALWGSAAAASPCEDAAMRGAAVHAARAALMRVPVGQIETQVGPAAQAAVERLKDRIVDFVVADATCAPAEALQRDLARRGDAAAVRAMPRDMHGLWLTYEVSRVAGHPALLAVIARFQIECGEDAVLLLFERRGAGWRPLIVRRSAPYRAISGSLSSLQFAVSPPDGRGRWYLAMSRGTSWCSSSWQGLHYELSRPGPTPSRPHVFFSRHVGTYIGYDEPDRLRAEANRFQVSHAGGIFDSAILIRRHVETYAVDGDRVRRVQPAAFNVRDFVDEWLATPWAEAASWSAPAPALAAAHRLLGPGPGGWADRGYGAIRRCAPALHQLEIGTERGPSWYLIVRGEGPWRVERAARASLASCNGPDLGPAIEAASQRALRLSPS